MATWELDKSGKGQGHSLVQPGGPRIPAERILSKECLLSRKSWNFDNNTLLAKVAEKKKLSDSSWFAKRLSSISTKTPNNKESAMKNKMPRPFDTY